MQAPEGILRGTSSWRVWQKPCDVYLLLVAWPDVIIVRPRFVLVASRSRMRRAIREPTLVAFRAIRDIRDIRASEFTEGINVSRRTDKCVETSLRRYCAFR